MKIGNRKVGPDHKPYVIAEIGVNHDGDPARAVMLTEAAARAGADAVKFQLFETDRLMSKAARLAAYQKNAGEADPFSMLRRLELSIDELAPSVAKAHELGIHAIVSVFSVELVEVAEQLPWDAYKSASPDIINRPLLAAMAATGKPLIVSTGASTLDEVVRAADWLDGVRDRLAMLQCVSCYPAPIEALGGIRAIAEATGLPVGYSDHTSSHRTGHYATVAGAALLEKHLTDDRKRAGPDHSASLLDAQLRVYVDSAATGVALRDDFTALVERALHRERSGDDKVFEWLGDDYGVLYQKLGADMLSRALEIQYEKHVVDCEQDVRSVSRQSLVATRALAAGDVLTRDDLTIKRPGTGIEPWLCDEIVGRAVARGVDADMPLVDEDFAQGALA